MRELAALGCFIRYRHRSQPNGHRVRPLGLAGICMTTQANVKFQCRPVDRTEDAGRQL